MTLNGSSNTADSNVESGGERYLYCAAAYDSNLTVWHLRSVGHQVSLLHQ